MRRQLLFNIGILFSAIFFAAPANAGRNSIMNDALNTINDTKPGHETATEEQVEEAESVYEWCTGNYDVSRTVDCQCLASEFLDLRIESGPDEPKMSLVAHITRRSCRNVEGASRMEYEKCMVGTSFKYYGFEPEDYCECYAREFGRLLEAYEGKLDESKKSTLRFKARMYCKKPEAYEGK